MIISVMLSEKRGVIFDIHLADPPRVQQLCQEQSGLSGALQLTISATNNPFI